LCRPNAVKKNLRKGKLKLGLGCVKKEVGDRHASAMGVFKGM